jgi:hypothetical protein
MNPRRVHELMRKHFPAFSAAERDWKNVVGAGAPSEVLLREVLVEHFGESEVLVEVHRKLGTQLPVPEVVVFVGLHIGEGQIRIANREFTSFVVVAQNGVATAWHA